jgi:tetratricopeptide (TPR) repeat protein
MGQILKFPVQESKFGYKRVRQRVRASENPDQLQLFPQPTAQILSFAPQRSPFEHALLLDERGDLKAAELYLRAIAEQDCIADSYCNLGIIHSRKGNITEAFDCFTTSLKHDPRHFESHFNLGNTYFDLNDFRLAQIHYEMAAVIDPTFANVYFNLALVQVINNDQSAASISLAKYQALVPEEEGRHACELLQNLKKALAAAKNSKPEFS